MLQTTSEQQQEEIATEKRRKRQLTEVEVEEKLLSGLQSPSSTLALRNENLFDRNMDFGQVCRNILQLEREQNMGMMN